MATVFKSDHGSKRVGSVPFAIALDSADIGTCEINGQKRYHTWGRNICLRVDASWYLEKGFDLVEVNDNFEVLFPASKNSVVETLLSLR
jgi:hypothetical protein